MSLQEMANNGSEEKSKGVYIIPISNAPSTLSLLQHRRKTHDTENEHWTNRAFSTLSKQLSVLFSVIMSLCRHNTTNHQEGGIDHNGACSNDIETSSAVEDDDVSNIINPTDAMDHVVNEAAGASQSVQTEEESFHTAMKPILTLLELSGLMPIKGIWDPTPRTLQFKYFSIRTGYTAFILLSFVALALLSIVYTGRRVHIDGLRTLGNIWEVACGTLYFVNAALISILFIRVASNWTELMGGWYDIEQELTQWNLPRLSKRFNIVTAYLIIPEFIYLTLNGLVFFGINFPSEEEYSCTGGFSNISLPGSLEDYFVRKYHYIFNETLEYELWIAIPIEIIFRFGGVAWILPDIFIILVSMGLTELFTQFNGRVREAMSEGMDSEGWKILRSHFMKLSNLVKTVDKKICAITLVCFTKNLCAISFQFPKIVIVDCNAMEKLYFFSAIFVPVLSIIILIRSAARIHEQSKASLPDFFSTWSENNCPEMNQLQEQIKIADIALTGLRMFPVTRKSLLTFGGIIITILFTLAQFMER